MNPPARLWIKVCGLRTREAIAAAAAAGADAVGFVFHEPSPRHLGAADAAELATAVPPGVARVAVFLHPSQELVDAAIAAVRPDWVQVDARDLAWLRLPDSQRVLPVLRTGQVSLDTQVAQLGPSRRFLLESSRSGAGERADWSEAARLAARGQLVLAGGLDAGNVADAVAVVRPFGVDVSSGVESSRGVKDARLIQEFVSAARAAEARLASSVE
jgi:phosphoribosylanthranilate isomerase